MRRRRFDRPIFVIAMPRSGSTLLFDLLAAHVDVFTWGDEAYPPWRALDPQIGGSNGDALMPETVLDPVPVEDAYRVGIAAHHGRVPRRFRLLDKTPPNLLRVAALHTMWPDARFIHLVRDAPSNIASLLEGRERGLAIRDWPKRNGMEWHFLMPAGWRDHLDRSPAEQFAWQWEVGNETAANDLDRLDYARVRYEDLVANPSDVLADLLTFAALRPSPAVMRAAAAMAPSKHTLSAPRHDKWREREAEIAPVLPALAGLRRALGYDPE